MLSGKAVLLTCGTGKVGRRMTALLATTSTPTFQATRSGDTTTEPYTSNLKPVAFDWNYETTWAAALAESQPHLHLTARDLEKAKAALGDLAKSEHVHLLRLDLGSLASVRTCAAEFASKSSKLNILIGNAGVMMAPESSTADGFGTQIGTNHLAHFLRFELLKTSLLASSTADFHSRVTFLSSLAHHLSEVNFDNLSLSGIYNPWVAYAQSKTTNIWTANAATEGRFSCSAYGYLDFFTQNPSAVDLLNTHVSTPLSRAARHRNLSNSQPP